MMMMKREMLGKQLRRSREVFGYSQIQVANLLGVSRQTVSNWENDKTIPDGISLIQLADIYHISLDELCGRTVLLKSTSHSVSKVEIGQILGLVGVFLCCSLVSLTNILMVGEKVFTTVTIDGQKVPLRSEFCKELLSENTGTKEVSQLLNTLCTMFDIKKIFMMGTDFQFYQKLKLQNKDVELIQVHTEETDTLSPRMAEKIGRAHV